MKTQLQNALLTLSDGEPHPIRLPEMSWNIHFSIEQTLIASLPSTVDGTVDGTEQGHPEVLQVLRQTVHIQTDGTGTTVFFNWLDSNRIKRAGRLIMFKGDLSDATDDLGIIVDVKS